MSEHEDLFKLMVQYRLAKVALYPDGKIRTAIALPPEPPEVSLEELDPDKLRAEAERLMFAASDPIGPSAMNGKRKS